jgi:hypothetical protein
MASEAMLSGRQIPRKLWYLIYKNSRRHVGEALNLWIFIAL